MTVPAGHGPPRPLPCGECGARHRVWRHFANCRWPHALWINGVGRYASVSACHPGKTIQLYTSRAEAEDARQMIDRLACGGACRKLHAVIDLGLTAEEEE